MTTSEFIDELTSIMKKIDPNIDENEFGQELRNFIEVYGISIGVGITAVFLMSVVLALIGFGSVGIVSGSVAAAWQASIGDVVAGSLFSLLQSVGMTGFSWAVETLVGIGSAATWFLATNNNNTCLCDCGT